jgi:hypothetical protein
MANCRGCGAEIIWAVTEKNNARIPLNPVSEMRMVQVGESDTGSPVVAHRRTYVPHHATCSCPEQFRKPRQ